MKRFVIISTTNFHDKRKITCGNKQTVKRSKENTKHEQNKDQMPWISDHLLLTSHIRCVLFVLIENSKQENW